MAKLNEDERPYQVTVIIERVSKDGERMDTLESITATRATHAEAVESGKSILESVWS